MPDHRLEHRLKPQPESMKSPCLHEKLGLPRLKQKSFERCKNFLHQEACKKMQWLLFMGSEESSFRFGRVAPESITLKYDATYHLATCYLMAKIWTLPRP